MSVIEHGDVDAAVKYWMCNGPVAPLVTMPGGMVCIYHAMPKGAPVPSVIITRAAGGPRERKDLPEMRARYVINVWGTTRDEASTIARTIVNELESLSQTPNDPVNGVHLKTASVGSVRWLPDPESDRPRYIVDTIVTTVTE